MAREPSLKQSRRLVPDAGEATGGTVAAGSMKNWKYTIGIQIFQESPMVAGELGSLNLNDFQDYPLDQPIPGSLFQAARTLLGLAQDDLTGPRSRPGAGEGSRTDEDARPVLSRKYLNDLENGSREMTLQMSTKLRAALEAKGARFVFGEGCIGVVTAMERAAFEARPRAARKRPGGADDAAAGSKLTAEGASRKVRA